MLWFMAALASAFSKSVGKILHKRIMADSSAYAYALVHQLLVGTVFLPLAIADPVISFSTPGLTLLLLGGVLWGALVVISLESYKHLHVSVREPIVQSRALFAFLFGVLFLSEPVYSSRLAGVLLVFSGLALVSWKPGSMKGFSFKGFLLALTSAILFGVLAVVDKTALNYHSFGVYGCLMYYLPAFFLLPFWNRERARRVSDLLSGQWSLLSLVVFTGFGSYFFRLYALSIADAGIVIPVVSLASILTVVIGMLVFRKERTAIGRKLAAVLLGLVGGWLLVSH